MALRLSLRRGSLSRNGCATRASMSASMPSAMCVAESKAQSQLPRPSYSVVISTACATLAATTARSGSSSPSKPSTISASRRQPAPFPVEVIAFADEEGLRFQTTYLGSCALAGSFDAAFLDLVDENGVTLREAMAAFGGEPVALAATALHPGEALAYLEVHIEQGPYLESVAAPVGVVTAISGQSRILAAFNGEAGHAGTVGMRSPSRSTPCGGRDRVGRGELGAADSWVAGHGRDDRSHPRREQRHSRPSPLFSGRPSSRGRGPHWRGDSALERRVREVAATRSLGDRMAHRPGSFGGPL